MEFLKSYLCNCYGCYLIINLISTFIINFHFVQPPWQKSHKETYYSDQVRMQQSTNLDISIKSVFIYFFHAKSNAAQVIFPHPVAMPSGKYGCQGCCRQEERDGEGIPALNLLG